MEVVASRFKFIGVPSL